MFDFTDKELKYRKNLLLNITEHPYKIQ